MNKHTTEAENPVKNANLTRIGAILAEFETAYNSELREYPEAEERTRGKLKAIEELKRVLSREGII